MVQQVSATKIELLICAHQPLTMIWSEFSGERQNTGFMGRDVLNGYCGRETEIANERRWKRRREPSL